MTRNRPWLPDDDDRLHELAKAGVPYEKIGKILGRTQQAIQNRCYVLKIRFRGEQRPRPRVPSNVLPEDVFFLDGQPLQFAEVDRPCARCAVRETMHHQFGCGQFAAEVRVRIK